MHYYCLSFDFYVIIFWKIIHNLHMVFAFKVCNMKKDKFIKMNIFGILCIFLLEIKRLYHWVEVKWWCFKKVY